MKKTLFFLVMVIALISCGKSNDGESAENGTYTLKVLKSEEITLQNVVAVYNGKTESEMIGKALKEDFVRTYQAKGIINISVSATGSDNSNLVVQLFKNDKLLKEASSKGNVLIVNVSN